MTPEQKMRATLVKQIRRGIIDLLNLAYPAALEFETICGSFLDIDAHYIKRDLSYFLDAGFIEWVNRTDNARWAGRKFKLTRTGVDQALSINTDSGLTP